MKSVIIILIVVLMTGISITSISVNAQSGVPPYFSSEAHQKIVEEGYSQDQIMYFIVLGVVGILISILFLHPKIRKKFNSDKEY